MQSLRWKRGAKRARRNGSRSVSSRRVPLVSKADPKRSVRGRRFNPLRSGRAPGSSHRLLFHLSHSEPSSSERLRCLRNKPPLDRGPLFRYKSPLRERTDAGAAFLPRQLRTPRARRQRRGAGLSRGPAPPRVQLKAALSCGSAPRGSVLGFPYARRPSEGTADRPALVVPESREAVTPPDGPFRQLGRFCITHRRNLPPGETRERRGGGEGSPSEPPPLTSDPNPCRSRARGIPRPPVAQAEALLDGRAVGEQHLGVVRALHHPHVGPAAPLPFLGVLLEKHLAAQLAEDDGVHGGGAGGRRRAGRRLRGAGAPLYAAGRRQRSPGGRAHRPGQPRAPSAHPREPPALRPLPRPRPRSARTSPQPAPRSSLRAQ